MLEEQKEEEVDNEKFVQIEILDKIINRVFKLIEEKKALETKRKTWNLKRYEERVESIKKKRAEWEFKPEVSVPLRDRFGAIFEKYGGAEIDEEDLNTEENMLEVPVTLAINQSVISIIHDQHKLVNKCLLHMMYRGMSLLKHLDYLKMVFLGSQGDVFSSFISAVFNDDF